MNEEKSWLADVLFLYV